MKSETRQINESDWKLLRQVHSRALDSFSERVLSEIKGVQEDTRKSPHEKYRRVWEVLRQRDKEMAEMFDDLKRSRAYMMLASMKDAGLLPDEDFLRLSPETQEVIRHLLG